MSKIGKFGPKEKDDALIGKACAACSEKFVEGDYTILVALGPGNNKVSQKEMQEGKFYNAVAVEIHWDCAHQEPQEEKPTKSQFYPEVVKALRSVLQFCWDEYPENQWTLYGLDEPTKVLKKAERI